MKILNRLQEMGQYLSEAMARMFSPSEDSYPAVGAQPFEGELHNKKNDKKLKKLVKN